MARLVPTVGGRYHPRPALGGRAVRAGVRAFFGWPSFMVKRILRGLAALVALALLVAVIVVWQKRNEIVYWWTAPKVHYVDMDKPRLPVYFFEQWWVAHPAKQDGADRVPAGVAPPPEMPPADIFYVHGSTFFGQQWNADAQDPNVATLLEPLMALEASAFNGCCRVFAPLYRQAHFTVIERPSGDSRNAFELAWNDVVRAFDSYISEENKGRPFILVGRDQGGLLVQRLLDDRIAPGTRVSERMVAAYVIGAGVPVRAFSTKWKFLHPCETPTDTRCVVAWETFADGSSPRPNSPEVWFDRSFAFFNEEERLCTNPLTWEVNGKADPAKNLGTLPASIDVSVGLNLIMGAQPRADVGRYRTLPALVPNYTGAECRNGLLYVPKPKDAVFDTGWRGSGNLHLHDVTLFWANIRENAAQRVEAFLNGRQAEPARAVGGY